MISPDLIDRLIERLGTESVSTEPADLEARSHDTWPVATKWAREGRHPYPAEAVVIARSVDEVSAVLALANAAGVPVTAWGKGSSVTGQPLPVHGGIVLDLGGLTSEPVIDETNLTVTVGAGFLGGELEDLLQERGLTLGHSPQSLYRSSVGGWLATLATGQFSSRYGGIEDLVVAYQVVLADGTVARVEAKPRAAMGPDLRRLFIGCEGTLGVITEVTLKVFPRPAVRLYDAFTIPTIAAGLAIMREQAADGLRPFLLRFYNATEARHALADPDANSPVMFIGTEGLAAMADTEMDELRRIVTSHGGVSIGPDPVRGWMDRRFDFSAVEKRLDTEGGFAETIEVAHYWSGIELLYDDLTSALAPLADEVLGHFSHVYTQGTSLYVILFGQAESDQAASIRLDEIWKTAMAICLADGAELSHHHGGGLARSPYASRSLGSAHQILRTVKDALDPNHILNPGKLGLDKKG